jgi:hypothetical protein
MQLLPEAAGDEGEPLDRPAVNQRPRVEVAERRSCGEAEKFGLRIRIVASDQHVADRLSELRVVEHFPEHILEGSDDARLREPPLKLLRPAAVPGSYEIAVVGVEGVADVDQQLAAEAAAMAVEQVVESIADVHGRKDCRSAKGL